MAKITRHIPSFMEGVEAKTCEFNSVEELLTIDWVDNFTKRSRMTFYQFSVSRPWYAEAALMAEYDDGTTWAVVGYFKDGEVVSELPNWEPKK